MNFDGSDYFTLEGVDQYENVGFAMPYYITGRKDNVLISSKVDSEFGFNSGVTFGLNKFNYPYAEFIDYKRGPITYCLRESLNNTGIIYFGITKSSVYIGYYDQADKVLKKSSFPLDTESFFHSNIWNIGGSSAVNSEKYFVGKIPEVAIVSPSNIDNNFLNIVSGFTHDVEEYVSTGYISGQTGTLYGDVIYISGCRYFLKSTQILDTGVELTGTRYFATSETLKDCLDKDYTAYTQQAIQYTYHPNVWKTYLEGYCTISTANNRYTFTDSGFIFEYTTVTSLPFLKNQELENAYVDCIYLKNNTDIKDKISVYALGWVNPSIDYRSVLYDGFNNVYKIQGTINTGNFSGFYYNGQLQTISNVYEKTFENGKLTYRTDRDYFISGNYIYSYNDFYQRGQNINMDTWPCFDFIFTGSVNSGEAMPGVNFGSQLVFLNGQKLHSGIDYENNTILVDIPTGYNVLSITKNKLNFVEHNQQGAAGDFVFFESFAKKTSSVWLNGVRLKNGEDYSEFSFINDTRSLYTKNGGFLLNGN